MVYVCSDIHGDYQKYKKALSILTDKDILYILGDVIDRGPDGIKIILDIMEQTNVILFIGNHEDMLIRAVEGDSECMDIWTCAQNGGEVTFNAFSLEDLSVQKNILSFLKDCPLIKTITLNGNNFVLLHSGIPEDGKDILYKDADKKTIRYVTWHSPFKSSKYASIANYKPDKTYIIGHVPTQHFDASGIFIFDNIIDIDCGCGFPNLYNIILNIFYI